MNTSNNRKSGLKKQSETKEFTNLGSLSKKYIRNIPEINSNFFENSLDAMMIGSQDGRIHAANSAACKMLGRSEKEICRLGRNGIVEQNKQLIEAVRKRRKSGNFFGELTLIKKDGTPFPVELSSSVFTNSDGREFTTLIIRDITERVTAEDRLRTSEEEYRNLFENSLVGISQSYPEGGYKRINKAYAEMYGYPDTETMLTEVFDDTKKLFFKPDNRIKVLKILEKEGFMPPTEFELNRRTGEKLWAIVGAIQVRDDAGNLLYLQAEHIDITSQKKMEEELRKSKELLEKLNQHLVEVRENERNQIALNLHDDLGQKLTAINLDIAWLKGRIGVQSKIVREKFEEMSSMIKETVESIRETSSLLRPAILFDLGLVPAIKSQLGKFEKQTGIKCYLYFEPEEFTIQDHLALILYRILQESLTNIARHSGASSTEVELQILRNKIEMIIKDDGTGIERDKVNSLKSMGIAGMRERVKSVRGKITFIGEPGSGTIIKVIIPIIKENSDD